MRCMSIRRLGIFLVFVVSVHAAAAVRSSSGSGATSTAGPRTDHALGFYDPLSERVVLVGAAGDPRHGERDMVWTWSGTRWEPVPGAGPPGRVNAGAAYDARRRKAIVAGGSRKAADGTTWEVVADAWEGDSSGWRQIGDILPRDHQSLVTDGRGAVLMFGGIPADRSGPWPTDTWELQGESWRRIATDGPAARGRAAMAYDSRRQQVVLFGGVSAPSGASQSQTFFDDTWIWDGLRWRKAAQGGPRGRYAHGLVFDERAGVVLLYGGAAAHRDAPLSDMWRWDGERWTEIPLTGLTPGHRYQPVMVHDRARSRTLLYGGIGAGGDTWEWDGVAWRRMLP